MTEGTKREPHERRYRDVEGRIAVVPVNDHGVVEVTEELLHNLFTATGLTEITGEDDQ